MKKEVNVTHTPYFDFERPLPALIKALQEIVEEHPSAYVYDDSYYEGTSLTIKYKRLETDKEEAAREAKEAAYQARIDAQDRVKFEALKKKFEGETK